MSKIIVIEKDGKFKSGLIKEINDLYKKCNFRKSEGFSQITTWTKSDIIVELWGRIDGKNNVKNSYKFPKNVTKQIFGNCCVVSKSKGVLIDMDEELWKKICNDFTDDNNSNDTNTNTNDNDNDTNTNDNDTNTNDTNTNTNTNTNVTNILDYSSDDSSFSSEDSFMDSELKEESYIYSDEEEKI